MNKATKNFMKKTKTKGKTLSESKKSRAEFYIGLTLAIYFRMLSEQMP